MKIFLKTSNAEAKDITDIKYDKTRNSILFMFKGKQKVLPVEESIGSYVKVFKDNSIEIISMHAVLDK